MKQPFEMKSALCSSHWKKALITAELWVFGSLPASAHEKRGFSEGLDIFKKGKKAARGFLKGVYKWHLFSS